MSAEFDYEELHHFVDRLSPTQARRLRLLVTQDEELSQVALSQAATTGTDAPAPAPAEGLLALIGSIDAPSDLAERHDDHIRERMRVRQYETPSRIVGLRH